MSILVVAILLSGYEAASHVVASNASQQAGTETAALLPCPDHHANDTPDDGKTIKLDINCHHCNVFPIGTTAATQPAGYPRLTTFTPRAMVFLVNGLTFPLFRPPQSLA